MRARQENVTKGTFSKANASADFVLHQVFSFEGVIVTCFPLTYNLLATSHGMHIYLLKVKIKFKFGMHDVAKKCTSSFVHVHTGFEMQTLQTNALFDQMFHAVLELFGLEKLENRQIDDF